MAKKDTSERQRLARLRELIAYYRELYYTEDTSEISDQAYDALVAEFITLEEKLEGKRSGLTEQVGGTPRAAFTKVRHKVPQWSFDNVFDLAELQAWEDRLVRYLEKEGVEKVEPTYVAEHKIDGLKIVLEYKGGILKQALTRGDGEVGEDVTHTAKTIKSLPQKLQYAVDLICVGEVWLGTEDFTKLNQDRQEQGEALFANPRNAAAGSLRQLDPAVARARNLSLFVYDIDFFASTLPTIEEPQTQWEELALLKKLGFPVNQYASQCATVSDIEKYYNEWKETHHELPYGVDGVVIKLDNIAWQHLAGYTAKSPRFGVAYKFPAVETTTLVENIALQVGRTGVVTPVAHLRPVLIAGSMVARATLHNEDQIKRLDVRVGDMVVVRKAGDVIPEVVQVITALRPANSKPYKFPKKVADCGGDGTIERVPGTAAYRCVSLDSGFLYRQKLYYFVSKTGLNIDGVGPKIIDALIDHGLIADAADLYTLTVDDFLTLPGFKLKSAQNAVSAIASARTVSLAKLLVALSIEQVGAETAILLATKFGTIDQLRQATYQELEQIHGIGAVVAKAVVAWQRDSKEQTLLDKLLTHLTIAKAPKIANDLAGLSFVFTGTLQTMTRGEAAEAVRLLGGSVSGSVSKKTSYVVVGEASGSKAEEAQRFGVKCLTEEAFKQLI